MESTKQAKAVAGKKTGNKGKKKEEPPEEVAAGKKTAGKKTAGKKAAGKKAAGKKAAGKKAAGKKAASRTAVNKKVKAVEAPPAAGKIERGRGARKQRTIPVPEGIEQSGAGAAERDPFEVAKQTMKGSVPAIVEAMVEAAKHGSCSHAKTLLEMTGATAMFREQAEMQDHGQPWAKLVLERMDEAERESLAAQRPEVEAEP